jgi:uncharacterized protein YbjT (DUF2867 family)
MRILLAGATGVIGRQAVPVLAAAGHEVTGLARTPARLPRRRGPGRHRQRPRPPPAGLEAHLHQLASRPGHRSRRPSSR